MIIETNVTWNPPTKTFSYGNIFTSENLNAIGSGGEGIYTYKLGNIIINANSILPAGSNWISVTYKPFSSLYYDSMTTVIFTVNKISLSINPIKTINYGTSCENLTSTYIGFVNNETPSVLTGNHVYIVKNSLNVDVTNSLQTESIGSEYTISVSGVSSNNYNITFGSSTLTINKKNLIISVDSGKSMIYGNDPPTFTSTYNSFAYGETLSDLTGTLSYTVRNSSNRDVTNNLQTQNAGRLYNIYISGVSSNNYNIIFIPSTLTINKANLTLTVDSGKSMIYGDVIPTFTSTYSGFINGETSSVLTGNPIYVVKNSLNVDVTNSLQTQNVDDIYTISISNSSVSSNNYNITFVPSLLTINKKILTINLNPITIEYGTTLKINSIYDEFVNNDNEKKYLISSLSYVITDLLLNIIPDSELSNLEVGNYFINLFQGSLTSNNYDINIGINNTTLTVVQKILKIYPDNKKISYGSQIPLLTSTLYNGFMNNEIFDNSNLDGNLIYIVKDSSGNIILNNNEIHNSGIYSITLLIGSLRSNNYKIIIEPNTSTLIIDPLTPNIIYNLPIKSYNYGLEFPTENLNARVNYNEIDITNNGTITYRLNSIDGIDSILLSSSRILNAGDYKVYAIFNSNNINYNSINTSANFTINKITPTITYSIPDQYKTMIYGNNFVKEQFNACVKYNNEPLSFGNIVYKLELSNQLTINTENYPDINTKIIYAEFISNNMNYNNAITFDIINVIHGNNYNNYKNYSNGNNKLITINSNGIWYLFNPKTKYYTKI
jgi:hypothetical protein